MPRGGRRTGVPGAKYPNRRDLSTQAVRTVTGQTYGQAGAQQAAQQTIPLPQQAPPPTAAPQPAQPPDLSNLTLQPGALGPLHTPTQRPNEPLTAGLSTGPGPGPAALGLPAPDPVVNTLRGIYARYPNPEIAALLQEAQRRSGLVAGVQPPPTQ
jgi:hypothetical protein